MIKLALRWVGVLLVIDEIDLSGLKGLLIDIDNTLYDYSTAHAVALSTVSGAFQRLCPGTLPSEEFHKRYRASRTSVTQRLLGQGACRSRFLAFQELLEQLGVPGAYVLAGELEDAYWGALIEAMQPNHALIDRIRAARAEGCKICAVTNMQARIQVAKLIKLGLEQTIDYLVTSEEVGCEKPSTLMFTTALEKLGLDASQAIMIGDSQTDDIEAAQRIGLKTCRITNYL